MKNSANDNVQGLLGLRRGVSLLTLLSRHPDGLTFSQVQELMENLPAPTLSRLLKVMLDEQLLHKDPDTGMYCSGEAARTLARGILGQVSVKELLQPVVRSLAGETGQSAAYAEFSDRAITFLITENMPDSFHYIAPGRPNPRIVRHGFGQVCLAHADKRTVNTAISGTGIPLPIAEDAFRGRLIRIYEEGCFVEEGEDRDACVRISAPVFRGEGGAFAGALGITVLATRLPAARRKELAGAVIAAAAEATGLLK